MKAVSESSPETTSKSLAITIDDLYELLHRRQHASTTPFAHILSQSRDRNTKPYLPMCSVDVQILLSDQHAIWGHTPPSWGYPTLQKAHII